MCKKRDSRVQGSHRWKCCVPGNVCKDSDLEQDSHETLSWPVT